MFGSIHLSGAILERTVENATACENCEVSAVDLTYGSGDRFDLCRRHYWELVAESREAVEGGGEDAEAGDDDPSVHVTAVERTALESFGIDLDAGVTSVTLSELAALDVAEVAAAVPEDPDAVRVLGLLADVDPKAVAGERTAVEACLPIAEAWDDAAAGASRVLGTVATVDPEVARTLFSVAATGEVSYHVARAIQRAVRRDLAATRSVTDENGDELLVETIAEAGRSGATSSPLFHTALLIAREDPGAFVDQVDAFLAPLDGEIRHQEAAGTAFDAAATLGYTATVDPDAVAELQGTLRALGETTHAHPESEAILRAAGAVAFAHSPMLAERASIDREWLSDRLSRVVDHLDLEEPTRAEAARALGRFAGADDREYLGWIAEGSEGEVARATRRAAAGEFRIEWSEGVLDSPSDGDPATTPLLDAVPDDPAWDVPEEYAVAFAVFEALGASPAGAFDPAADQWVADWTAPLARLSPHHDLAVLDLSTAVNLDALALAVGLDVVTYDHEHLPFLRYEPGSEGQPVFLSASGVAVCPRVTDRETAEAALLGIAADAREIDPAVTDEPTVRFTSVGAILDCDGRA